MKIALASRPQFGRRDYLTANSGIAPVLKVALGLSLLFGLAACGDLPTAAPSAPPGSPSPPAATTRARPSPSPTPSPAPTPTPQVSPADLNGARVELWHAWTGPAGEAIQSSAQAFNAGNEYGIAVETRYQGNYNQLGASLEEAAAAGALPDLAATYDYLLLAWEAPLVDLAGYVNDPHWGLSTDERGDFYPVFLAQEGPVEDLPAFPVQRSAQLLYYNLTWAGELGFAAPPANPQEFRQQACAAARANENDADPQNDGTGGWVVNTTPASILSWMQSFGGDPLSPRGDGYRFDTPQVEQALRFLKELYDQGCAWKVERSDAAEGLAAGEHAHEEFAARKALFITASLADLADQSRAMEAAGNRDAWTALAFPSPQGKPAISVYGPSLALFPSKPAQQLAAWLFVRWLVSPQEQARFVAASGTFPARRSAAESLQEYAAAHPQWTQALEWLPEAYSEPGLPSWSAVRWLVSDVGTQLFRSYFNAGRLPATLELMESTAAELHGRFP